MARQTVPQKQFLSLKQAIIILSIIALMFFAFKYGQNVLRYRELQSERAAMDGKIAAVEQEKQDINRAFDDSLSPAVIETFVRSGLGWVRPGDEVIITIGGDSRVAENSASPAAAGAADGGQNEAPKPNWQLWLDLLAGD